MSTNSNDQGRAYEYAWMTALYKKLAVVRKTCVVANSSLDANKRAWNAISRTKGNCMLSLLMQRWIWF